MTEDSQYYKKAYIAGLNRGINAIVKVKKMLAALGF
jgi:hypothetical protein